MDKVYIVESFDGDSNNVLKVFVCKDKADKYAKKYEKDQDEVFGQVYDKCYVREYEVIQ